MPTYRIVAIETEAVEVTYNIEASTEEDAIKNAKKGIGSVVKTRELGVTNREIDEVTDEEKGCECHEESTNDYECPPCGHDTLTMSRKLVITVRTEKDLELAVDGDLEKIFHSDLELSLNDSDGNFQCAKCEHEAPLDDFEE